MENKVKIESICYLLQGIYIFRLLPTVIWTPIIFKYQNVPAEVELSDSLKNL